MHALSKISIANLNLETREQLIQHATIVYTQFLTTFGVPVDPLVKMI